jgi:Rrf2 family iron-sulfur cluster assembly transcriptional regulator
MVQLAREASRGLTISQLATREGLSTAHVGKLMRVLRQAGLVRSVRGKAGGYHLIRPAADITILEVLKALDGNLFAPDAFCNRYSGLQDDCVHAGNCCIRKLWVGLATLIDEHLKDCSLLELAGSESTLPGWMREDRPSN